MRDVVQVETVLTAEEDPPEPNLQSMMMEDNEEEVKEDDQLPELEEAHLEIEREAERTRQAKIDALEEELDLFGEGEQGRKPRSTYERELREGRQRVQQRSAFRDPVDSARTTLEDESKVKIKQEEPEDAARPPIPLEHFPNPKKGLTPRVKSEPDDDDEDPSDDDSEGPPGLLGKDNGPPALRGRHLYDSSDDDESLDPEGEFEEEDDFQMVGQPKIVFDDEPPVPYSKSRRSTMEDLRNSAALQRNKVSSHSRQGGTKVPVRSNFVDLTFGSPTLN